MSLNGLDHPAIQEAYQHAQAEAGGWFLLKYTSRDSVELLARGKSGVHEARTAISKYEEPSPLYGLIIYRRRKVLIKFIPEGTSRLLQARTAVHFQDVIERYQPYETLLEITTAEGLNDTSLAASFPLHTASPAASSNRLHEISEDGEDLGASLRRGSLGSATAAGATFGSQRHKMERRVDQILRSERPAERPTPSIQLITDDAVSPLFSPLTPSKTHISQYIVREAPTQRSISSLGSPTSTASTPDGTSSDDSGKSIGSDPSANDLPTAHSQSTYAPLTHRSSQSSQPSLTDRTPVARSPPTGHVLTESQEERPAERTSLAEAPKMSEAFKRELSQPFDYSQFDHLFKPKVKLGPRPVVAGERVKRPTVASIGVPPSYRATQKKQEPAATAQRTSQGPMSTLASMPVSVPALPPIPDTPEYNPRPVSRGSVRSLPSHKSTAMTPDKIRLMKAVELRKKQLRKSNPPDKSFVPPKDEEVPSVPKVPAESMTQIVKPQELEPEPTATLDEDHTPSKKPDSGIEMEYDRHERAEAEKRATATLPDSSEHQHREQHEETSDLPAGPPVLSVPEAQSSSIGQAETHEPTMSLDMLENTHEPKPSMIEALFADGPAEEASAETKARSSPEHLQNDGANIQSIATADISQPRMSAGAARKREDVNKEALDGLEGDGEQGATRHTLEAPSIAARPQNSDLAKRRRGVVEPLHVEPHADADLASDDDLLEELHTATVQEAKPVTVARSPMTPPFARQPSGHSLASDRSVPSVKSVNIQRQSSPLLQTYGDEQSRRSSNLSTLRHERSNSATTPPKEKIDSMASAKRNVSDGIQRRIQTLAEVSAKDGGPSGHDTDARPLSSETSPDFMQRERPTPRSSVPRSRTSSYRSARQSGRMNGVVPTASANGGQPAANQPVYNVQHDPASSRDSVSVTARIVRPTAATEDETADRRTQEMQQSQLVINHKRASNPSSNLNKALPNLNLKADPSTYVAPSTGSSPPMSPSATPPSTEFRSLHSANRKSFGRYRQSPSIASSIDDLPVNMTTTTITSHDENAGSKEGSRTSRFFKRMSGLGGTTKRRQSGAPQSVDSNSSLASTADLASLKTRSASGAHHDKADMPPAVTVGDLNVQFPDSLLWKRRIVEIDDAGYLIISITQAMDIQKGSTKKFHMSDFKIPHTPNLDRQELPHSVMLDFGDGTTLQAACEDAMTHRQVLHLLRMYWKAWTSA